MKLAANKRSEEFFHRKEILGMDSADSGEKNTANNTTNATSKIANSIGRTVPPPTSTTLNPLGLLHGRSLPLPPRHHKYRLSTRKDCFRLGVWGWGARSIFRLYMLLASERHRGEPVARTVVGVQVSQAGAVGGADAGGKIRAGGSGLIEPRLASPRLTPQGAAPLTHAAPRPPRPPTHSRGGS